MMRPSDQAKLLFLYLLRSSSALATRATTSTTTTTTATTTTSTTAVGNIGNVNVNVNVNVNMNANVNMNVAAASASGTMNSMNMNMNSMRDTFHSIGKSLNKVNANAKSKANTNVNANGNANVTSKKNNMNTNNNNNTNPKNNMNPELQGHISLRLATRLDVPSIQRCNLASLPENYSSNFYVNHIRSFPDLALVAEHVPPGATSNSNNSNSNNSNSIGGKKSNGGGRRNPFDNYNPSTPESQIIGYVLGKIEQVDTPEPPSSSTSSSSRTFTPSTISTGYDDLDDYLSYNNHNTPEMIGHVTSLAVLKPYRRNGLAALLMKQLHFHMQYGHSASGVGLHVRVSNVAARRLYCEGMGYGVVDVIRGYYADGEDAFFMKKKLLVDNGTGSGTGNDEYTSFLESEQEINSQKRSLGSRWSFRRKNNVNNGNGNVAGNGNAVYENGPLEFRLPMIIPLNNGNANTNTNGNSDDSVSSDANANAIDVIPGMVDDSSEEEDAHVMTGSL